MIKIGVPQADAVEAKTALNWSRQRLGVRKSASAFERDCISTVVDRVKIIKQPKSANPKVKNRRVGKEPS